MDYKFMVVYSYYGGEVQNHVGCFTENQAKEIGEAILQWAKRNVGEIDSIDIYNHAGDIVERIF